MTTDQVIAPNIFDVIDAPAAVLPLVLANAMSERTWALSRRAADGVDVSTPEGQHAALEALRRVIDRSFTHLTASRVAEINGTLDLAAERARLGDDVMDHALAAMIRNAELRAAQGHADADGPIAEMIAHGAFPAYSYANVDIVHATRRHTDRSSRRPKGITSCLDEAALFGALCMTLPTDHLLGIALLASPVHYTVFLWTPAGGAWFYGKNALMVGDGGGDDRATLLACTGTIDRIISRRGHVDLRTREGSIPVDELARTHGALMAFFGGEVPGLGALDDPIRISPPSPYDRLFEECLSCDSAAEVRGVVMAHARGDGPLAAAAREALASYRWLGISDLSGYVAAARRGPRVTAAGRVLHGLDDALAVVAGVAGTQSPLDDRDRIALPDEVLAFGTGSDRDRALLLHVLADQCTGEQVTTVFMPDDSFVCVGDVAIRMSDLARLAVPQVDGLVSARAGSGHALVMSSPPE